VYTGTFIEGVKEGHGVLEIKDSSYVLKSLFVKDKPEYECNKFTCQILEPKIEEAPIDPKAKKGKDEPKPQSKFTEEEEEQYGQNKIYYEYKRDAE
jgi:hypothetical protein